MALITTRALILQAFPYSDTSKILRLLTREHGVRSAIAKGAQRPKSRFGGLLESFTEGDAQLYLKEGRDLHTLTGFDLRRSRQSLGRDLVAFSGAAMIAELVLRFGSEEPHPALFRLLSGTLDRLATGTPDEAEGLVLAAAWMTISLLGYRPETEACVTCGRELSPDEPSRFDLHGGGVACTACRPAGRVLDPASLRELRAMVEGRVPERPGFENPALQRALLSAFLSEHLSREQPLRALHLFFQQVQ